MSILRRIHANNFTIIGNACLCDETLSAEALGVICYLIGRPHDWVVQQGQLADRFKCGRDRIQRIVRELIETGYIIKADRRSSSGSYLGVEYVVLDTKSDTLPPALSPHQPQPENTAADVGEPENPQPVNPAPVNPPLQRTDSNKTESNKTPKAKKPRKGAIQYTGEFQALWESYPMRDGTSKSNAFKKFEALTPEEQLQVKTTVPVYARMADRQKFTHHLEFYISRRIFETIGLAPGSAGNTTGPAAFDRKTWENLSKIYESSNNWNRNWGPEPGNPQCVMPLDLQQRFVNHGLTAH